jgi:hypothetical protein
MLRAQVDGLADVFACEYLAATDGVAMLREEVGHLLAPHRQCYRYRQANVYAREAERLVRVVEGRTERPPVDLVRVTERAVDLTRAHNHGQRRLVRLPGRPGPTPPRRCTARMTMS